jgi:PAS domain S-box-containing protein
MRSRLAAIVESSEDAIFSEDLNGVILTWNRAAAKMYGYATVEVVGQPIHRLVPPERAVEASAILEQLKRGKRLENYESERLRKDGTRLDVSLNISPLTDATGQVTGWSVIARDISERKRGERRLAAEHAVTRALACSSSIEDAGAKVLQTIGETMGCDLGVLWEVRVAPGVLRCVAVWRPPGVGVTEFEEHSRRIAFARGEGLPGRVWSTGQPDWVPEAPFPRSVAARRGGPGGALAFPLRNNGGVLGVIELFGPDLHLPQDIELASMASIGTQVGQFIERRQAEIAWLERQREFRLAHEIQQGLFPKAAPTLPGFAIAGASQPTQETGGDYFDFIPLADGQWVVAVGDASGHGIGAALVMAETRAYLRALAVTHTDPGELLRAVNERLVEDIGVGRFVTLFLARLDPRTRGLVYSNAGHWPGYVFDARGEVKLVLQSASPPLGVNQRRDILDRPAIMLESGDLVFLLTDGIVEATSGTGSLFGIDRALEVVRANRHKTSDEIIAALFHEVREWFQSAQGDDMTAIVIKVGG